MDTLVLLVTSGVVVGLIGMACGQVLHTYVIVRRNASRVNEGQAIFPFGYPLNRYLVASGVEPTAERRNAKEA